MPGAMTTRGIRRKKSSLSEVKVAVLGAPTVGKSGTYPNPRNGVMMVVFWVSSISGRPCEDSDVETDWVMSVVWLTGSVSVVVYTIRTL